MDYIQAILGLFCMVAIKTLDLADPDIIFFARCAFACGSSLVLITLALLYAKISAANDQQQIVLTQGELTPQPPLAAMLGAPASPDANKPAIMTHKEYDLVKLRAAAQTAITTMAITTTLHLWKGFMPPLIFQSVLGMAGLLSGELATIHLFGKPATKDLKRPWKAKSAFSAFKDIKKEMAQGMADGSKPSRKNKKAENALKVSKSR